MVTAIEVHGLTKRYGQTVAVDDVSFQVERGSVFAFVGTNGAGKSTTIACLTTLLGFEAGEVTVLGHDVRREGDEVRRGIGVVFQESIMDPLLSVRENLRVRGAFYRSAPEAVDARITELGELIGLSHLLTRRYGRISGGERRRADIARALLASPSVIFLDEPTAGLDPAGRASVWSTIRTLRERHGLTVFLTTHYLEETEEADQVCMIDRGRIVAAGTPAELRARYSSSVLSVTTTDLPALAALATAAGCSLTEEEPARITVPDAHTAMRILEQHGAKVVDFEFRHGTMDDVFLAVTASADREEPRA
ncbi:ATP-binding cassette domain-containing protein [Lysinimonas soli]|uniref:ATP-binding cassette domain-containing protein n=1 Tax=Lysinimonas soli TaxID=1074233 RepID=A0ABW0NK36_9MICO